MKYNRISSVVRVESYKFCLLSLVTSESIGARKTRSSCQDAFQLLSHRVIPTDSLMDIALLRCTMWVVACLAVITRDARACLFQNYIISNESKLLKFYAN